MKFFEDCCQRNTTVLEKALKELLEEVDGSTKADLSAFADRVEREGQVGMNMRPMVLLDFLQNDRLMNIHEWAAHKSSRSKKSLDDILREKLGPYFDRRIAFDNHFEGGTRFRYGTLSIGGLGPRQYGEYCAVFKHADVMEQCQVGYLKSDSLNNYLTPDLDINEVKLRCECAPESHKHMLATMKHADKLTGEPQERWPEMLCSGDDYVEAVLAGDLSPGNVAAVRISNVDYELYWEHAYK